MSLTQQQREAILKTRLAQFLEKKNHTFPGLGSALRMSMERIANRGPSPDELRRFMQLAKNNLERRDDAPVPVPAL